MITPNDCALVVSSMPHCHLVSANGWSSEKVTFKNILPKLISASLGPCE